MRVVSTAGHLAPIPHSPLSSLLSLSHRGQSSRRVRRCPVPLGRPAIRRRQEVRAATELSRNFAAAIDPSSSIGEMEVAEPWARQPATLPMDLLLEIITRSDDVATVVRCAAGCKPLRHAMLGPGFIDRLRRRAEANGGFDPSLLMAVSYRLPDHPGFYSTRTNSVVVQPPGRLRHFDTDLLPMKSSETQSSRDGLLVIKRHGILLVCNAITGHVISLPSTDLQGSARAPGEKMYQPALLSVDSAGRSFELLVMSKRQLLRHQYLTSLGAAQIFSSREDKWGAVREIHIHNLPEGFLDLMEASSSAPAVVGCRVHWLCYTTTNRTTTNRLERSLALLALHAESAQASIIKLPQELLTRMGSSSRPETRILAATATATVEGEKRLSLVVAEALVISTWTLVVPGGEEGSSIRWSRQVVIRRREIDTLTNVLDAYQPIWLCMFGERSGTVLLWMQRLGLIQLNLLTKKSLVLWRGSDFELMDGISLLHEMNLISVLECMKSF